VTHHLRPQAAYDVRARQISGSHAEKLDQIDEAIQELLEIKLLECAADRPGVQCLAAPRRSHWFAMTMAILVMLVLLVLLLAVRPAHAREGTARMEYTRQSAPADHSSAKR